MKACAGRWDSQLICCKNTTQFVIDLSNDECIVYGGCWWTSQKPWMLLMDERLGLAVKMMHLCSASEHVSLLILLVGVVELGFEGFCGGLDQRVVIRCSNWLIWAAIYLQELEFTTLLTSVYSAKILLLLYRRNRALNVPWKGINPLKSQIFVS